jgi:hypothetical protein
MAMARKLAMGLAATLLVSGLLAGGASGRSAAMSTSIEVFSGDVLKEGDGQLREEALDADGTRIGTVRWNCAPGVDYHCTVVYDFNVFAPGGKGAVVVTGIFKGFTGETLAVTGGTKAYEGASGSITLTSSDEAFTHTLNLLP